MKEKINQKISSFSEIKFCPETEAKNEVIVQEIKNFEIDENEILKDNGIYNEYDEFLNDKEYQFLFEEMMNEVYSYPLYFIKKINYFYNKGTFLECYFLKLKKPSKKYHSTITKKDKEDSLNIINGKSEPDNKNNTSLFLIFKKVRTK